MAPEKRRRIGLAALIGLLSSPFVIGAVRFLDTRYVHETEYRMDRLRDSTFQAQTRAQLEYIACRQDFTLRECIPQPPRHP